MNYYKYICNGVTEECFKIIPCLHAEQHEAVMEDDDCCDKMMCYNEDLCPARKKVVRS